LEREGLGDRRRRFDPPLVPAPLLELLASEAGVLRADPFVDLPESCEVRNADRGRPARVERLPLPHLHAVDVHGLDLRLEAEDGTAVRLAVELRVGALPDMPAVWALAHARVEDPLTLGALLRRRGSGPAVARAAVADPDLVDGPVFGDDAGEVEEEAVRLALGDPHPPPDHLDVEDRALRRPEHSEEVGVRRVEPGG